MIENFEWSKWFSCYKWRGDALDYTNLLIIMKWMWKLSLLENKNNSWYLKKREACPHTQRLETAKKIIKIFKSVEKILYFTKLNKKAWKLLNQLK